MRALLTQTLCKKHINLFQSKSTAQFLSRTFFYLTYFIMNRYGSFLFLILFTGLVSAQTKLIFHKSHSGSNANFALAIHENLFNIHESNLGHAPTRMVENAALDSVIFVSDREVILVTKVHFIDMFRETFDSTIWTPGREIVIDHPLFSKKHALDSIKQVLKTTYNFQNDIDSTVFIGYDNQSTFSNNDKKDDKSLIPIVTNDHNVPSKGFLILAVVLISFLVTIAVYKFIPKTQHF